MYIVKNGPEVKKKLCSLRDRRPRRFFLQPLSIKFKSGCDSTSVSSFSTARDYWYLIKGTTVPIILGYVWITFSFKLCGIPAVVWLQKVNSDILCLDT